MFICPTCNKEFSTEDMIRNHLSNCWKETHPYHKSNPAPHSQDIVVKEVSDDIADFFNSFSKGV